MKLPEIEKKMMVLGKKLRELHHVTALLRSIKKHEEEDKLIPDPVYVGNIERRIGTLENEFDELLK